jgi:hypothetical protein
MATTKSTDASRRVQTQKRLTDFADDLKTALDASLPSSGPNYNKVSVLALHWENDTMGVVDLESQLLEVFSNDYGYGTESFTIPTASSANSLIVKLANWSNAHGGPRTLRIYVYSGHASGAGTTNDKWFLGSVVTA